MEVEFDRSKYPQPLITSRDYKRACEEFVLPFMQQRAAICADIVDEMKELADTKENEVQLVALADKLKDITGFANKSSNATGTEAEIRDFINEVISLEHALESTGEFANEPK